MNDDVSYEDFDLRLDEDDTPCEPTEDNTNDQSVESESEGQDQSNTKGSIGIEHSATADEGHHCENCKEPVRYETVVREEKVVRKTTKKVCGGGMCKKPSTKSDKHHSTKALDTLNYRKNVIHESLLNIFKKKNNLKVKEGVKTGKVNHRIADKLAIVLQYIRILAFNVEIAVVCLFKESRTVKFSGSRNMVKAMFDSGLDDTIKTKYFPTETETTTETDNIDEPLHTTELGKMYDKEMMGHVDKNYVDTTI